MALVEIVLGSAQRRLEYVRSLTRFLALEVCEFQIDIFCFKNLPEMLAGGVLETALYAVFVSHTQSVC